MNLGVDHLQVAQRRLVGLAQFGPEQLQMNADGVDGVFDLVADAGGKPADGGHTPRELQLRLDLLDRLQVVQRNQRAQCLTGTVVVDKVQRGLYAAPGLGENLLLHQGTAGFKGIEQGLSQYR